MNAVRKRWQQIRALRLGRALRLVWQITPLWSALNLGLIAVQGLLPLAALYAMKRIVDAAAAQSVRDVLTWAGIAAGVALFNALMQAVAEYSNQAQSQLLTDEITDILHARSIAVDLGYYEQPDYYDTLHRAQQEGPYRPAGILNDLVRILQSGISLAGIAALLVSFHWQVGIVMLLAALPGLAVRLFFSRRQYDFELQQAEKERYAWYYHWLITDAGHAAELRLYGLGELFRGRFRALRAALRQGRLRLALRQSGYSFAVRALAALALFGAFAFAAAETVRGLLTLGSLVVIYLGFQNGLGYLQGMLNALASLYESNLFLTQFYQFLDLPAQITAPAQPRPLPRPMRQGVTFEGVRFAYPGTQNEALRGVDITLRPGEVIALVGENGAGKTTLIKLLCRLYDPAAGRVRVDGVDLRDLDPREWQAQMSVVLQDFARYFLSAGENIWLGDASRPPGEGDVRRAARLAGADSALEKLPAGYDTQLGKVFTDGTDLSQGEWQKVALARAFYREDAAIVVLDEPTSALDPLAEAELFARFRALIAGRSAILISHRFSTVQMADRIYVLEHGRVTEHGTHAELLARGGQYARMYTAQAQYYQETGHEQPAA